jgi:hypothetical protein
VTTYTYAQLEGLWTGAGGSATLAPLMAAIALAESSGDSNSKNTAPCGTDSFAEGLWQICFPLNSQYVPGGNPLNPQANASAAVAIVKAQGLTAWTTYSSGAYKQFLNGSVPPQAVAGGAAGGAAGATLASAQSNCDDSCLWCLAIPGLSSVPLIGGAFQTCIIRKTEARAMIGGALIITGGLVGMVGVFILAAYGFRASGAGTAAGRSLEAVGAGVALIPGAEVAGAAINRGGAAARRAGARSSTPRTRAPARPARQQPIVTGGAGQGPPQGTYGRRARPDATTGSNGLPAGTYGRRARPRPRARSGG